MHLVADGSGLGNGAQRQQDTRVGSAGSAGTRDVAAGRLRPAAADLLRGDKSLVPRNAPDAAPPERLFGRDVAGPTWAGQCVDRVRLWAIQYIMCKRRLAARGPSSSQTGSWRT